MLKKIDALIDKTTTYRLLLYYLIGLLLAAIGLSIAGDIHFKASYIFISSVILVTACYVINKIFAFIFDASTNAESSIITGLILALIITPDPVGYGILFLLAASGLAMAPKYLLTINKKHIFNPAAIAVVLTALGPRQSASWWVGSAAMLPFVIIGGILITRKTRRLHMVLSFFIASILATITYSIIGHTSSISNVHNLLISSALFFLGFVMLTEPLTSPSTQKKQSLYGFLVGILLPPQVNFFKFYFSPELALIVGNVFSYIVSPKTKLFPVLIDKSIIAKNTMDFVFRPDKKLKYKPGQYIELTLQHTHTDSRGSRRYFTLASSPTEDTIRFGVKFYKDGSSFKTALLNIDRESQIVAAQPAGDFVLPGNPQDKLVFIAGGIGITPFRSMVKYLIDMNEKRNITIIYAVRDELDVAYKQILDEARQKLGLKVYYVIEAGSSTDGADVIKGRVSPELIKSLVPDYLERKYYISGTHTMVESLHAELNEIGVKHTHIKQDFFPGYA